MLITCPECQFARNINTSSIPSKAQLATCPRCKTKFRFRILHEEEQLLVAEESDVPVAQNVKEELKAAVEAQSEQASPMKRAAGDAVEPEADIIDDYIESEMVAAMQEEIEDLLKAEETEGAEKNKGASKKQVAEDNQPTILNSAVSKSVEDSEGISLTPSVNSEESISLELGDVHGEPAADADDQPKMFIKRSASAQALRERGIASKDVTSETEEEAIRAYMQEQESSAVETASVHIVPDTGTETDIWDAIAAMGGEHECTESFAPGCGSQVDIIPWEDSRLSVFGRFFSTLSGLFVRPARFWRGINAKPQIMLPMLFSLLVCAVSCIGVVVGAQVLSANWTSIAVTLQSTMPQQGIIPDTVVWFDVASAIMAVLCSVVLVLPFLLSVVTTYGARLLGGDPVPFSTGVKVACYSSGALFGLLLPVAGAIISLVYLPLLYVNGVRTGYNLSLFKSVVLVGTVLLLFAALALMAVAAGVTLM